MKILAVNKKATFDYEILETYEAGLVLYGHEVKAIKSGHISLVGSYVVNKGNEFFLINALVPPYQPANTPSDYDPGRSRKLLLKKSEINSLIGKAKARGLTLVPLKIYTKKSAFGGTKGRIKLEFGLGKGKKKIDKREKIKRRDIEKEIGRRLKGARG